MSRPETFGMTFVSVLDTGLLESMSEYAQMA